jgi:hypothetical protein
MERNKNIQNELKEISVELAKVPFISTLQVPKGYFEGLEDRIIVNIKNDIQSDISDAKKEIQKLSPLLSEIIDKNTYKVDADYFEQKAVHLAGIPLELTARVIQFPIRKRIIHLAIAASFIGMLALFTYLLWANKPPQDLVQKGLEIQTEDAFNHYLDHVNEEEIIAYLNQHYLPSDNDAIGGFIDVNDLPEEAAYLEEVMIGKN